jgi:predicted Zn-dependent protease
VYLKKGLVDSAISEFEDSMAKLTDNPVVRYHLGMAYHEAGKLVMAKTELSAALNMSSDFDGAEHARELLNEL